MKLRCEEALYGGAAGGGKTEALLMWLAEGIHLPGYSGIFFRRTYPQLAKSNDSPITKSHELYGPLGGVYKSSEHQWNFPSGARIELGHLQHENSVFDYQGPAYHRVAYDELTQFSEGQYLWMFGRMRARAGFPLSMGIRAASNPGGPGHLWVKNRFIPPEAQHEIEKLTSRMPSPPGLVFWPAPNRAFVPARVADNPSLDINDYIERMSTYLPPVLRERMLNGDWSIREDARISPDWLRYWTPHFGNYQPLGVDQGTSLPTVHTGDCERFITVDCAGSSDDVAKTERTGVRSRSVVSIWDRQYSTGWLFWRDATYGYWEFPALLQAITDASQTHRPSWIGIEDEKTGRAAIQSLRDRLPVRPMSHEGRDKLARAQTAILMLEKGQIFLPVEAPWRQVAEAEMLSWTGHPKESADFIDTLAYAAKHAAYDSSVIIYESLYDGVPYLSHSRRFGGRLGFN